MMLQKAASNAYSWWWVSHIRTKQSKWLEQNLQDMEEKVCTMLEIIDDDGDSFAKRAEIYFKKRPELVSIVEECYRAYQALAERYDHLSKDLQSANRTIATVFPEQVPCSIDEEEDEESPSPRKTGVLTPSGPRVQFPNKDFRRQGPVKKVIGSAKANAVPSSGLNKDEALDEIDKLQKEISDMQTEREFLKRSYEEGYKKFCEIDNQITEKQRSVCNLRVEFGVGSVIDENDAWTLMANRDLKSCQESSSGLEDKHEQSTEDAKVESKRIKHENQKFKALRNKFGSPQRNQQKKHIPTKNVDKRVYEFDNMENKKHDSEVFRYEIKEKVNVSLNASRTMSQLAEKIDELVQRVVNWETAFFSKKDLEKRLKSNKEELQEHSKSLEEDEEAEIEGPEIMNSRMNMLEGELSRVKDLVETVVDQINSLKTHSYESSCNVDNLSVKAEADAKPDREIEEHRIEQAPGDRSALKGEDVSTEGKNNVDFETSNEFDVDSSKGPVSMEEDKAEKKYLSDTASSIPDTEIEELETDDEEEEQPNWRQLYLDGLDDREKIVIDEYSSVLENYKEVRKKLNEVDKKNRDGFFELAMQIRELKNAVASRDGEIQTLHRKIGLLDESKYGNSVDIEVHRESPSEESTLTNSIQASPSAVGQGKDGSIRKAVELETTTHGRFKESFEKMGGNNKTASQPRRVSAVENKIRSGIDELLEENLEFWLRFNAAFNQIKKYQTSVKDLKAELSTLREKNKKQEGKMEHMKSEIRPIYCQFRETRTELTLWLENNGMFKDEVECRYSSLCNIENKISASLSATELSGYQAAKFQGEVLNMKHEINKVSNELKSGFENVRQLNHEVEKLMNNLEKELGSLISSMSQQSKSRRLASRIPLRSFLFGIKLRNSKQSEGSPMVTCKNRTKPSR